MTRQNQWDPAGEKTEQLKTATREANEVLADLKRTLKEVRQARDEVAQIIERRFDEKVEEQVAASIAKLGEATDTAMRNAVDKVIGEFDKLSDILMGRDRKSKREGRKSIPELIEEGTLVTPDNLIIKDHEHMLVPHDAIGQWVCDDIECAYKGGKYKPHAST